MSFARLLAAGVALSVLGVGCVTKGKHDEVTGALRTERDALAEKVRELSLSNRALDDERVRLLEQMEDLRQARDALESDIAKLERSRELLEQHLREREQEVQKLAKLSDSYEGLVNDLEAEVASGQIQIEQLREGLRLNLAQDILFRSGSATLEPYGVEVLEKVARQLEDMGHTVEVQGHTDDVPLSASLARRWGTNWELAGARAAQVVRLFQRQGVAPARLRVVSYGPYAPVAENDTPEGRARNRRIEIRLVPVSDPVAGDVSGPPPEAEREPEPEPAGG